jgi:hypothetical protein
VSGCPPDALEFPDDAREFDKKQIDDAFEWNISLVAEKSRHFLAAAKTNMYVHRGDMQEARRLYDSYRRGPFGDSRELDAFYAFNKRFDLIDF